MRIFYIALVRIGCAGSRSPAWLAGTVEHRNGNRWVFVGEPAGASPSEFSAVFQAENRVVFENPDHDWPKRIEYWRNSDTLHARASGGDRTQEWSWELSAESRCSN
ncbi:MAG: hypothetical protein AAF654_06925 [Myxococcota bacterium]